MKFILEQNFSEITIHTVAENWLSQRYVAVAWHSWRVCTVTMTGSDNVWNEQINNIDLHLILDSKFIKHFCASTSQVSQA